MSRNAFRLYEIYTPKDQHWVDGHFMAIHMASDKTWFIWLERGNIYFLNKNSDTLLEKICRDISRLKIV